MNHDAFIELWKVLREEGKHNTLHRNQKRLLIAAIVGHSGECPGGEGHGYENTCQALIDLFASSNISPLGDINESKKIEITEGGRKLDL